MIEPRKGFKFYNADCMDIMSDIPDKYFDLAVVDPPYGIGISSNPFRQKFNKQDWDNEIPTDKYFTELERVSKNRIIWGGNFFNLPISQGFIIWDKKQPENFSSSMCEFAWMSLQKPAKIFYKHVVTAETNKIHPTQKPKALYKWIYDNYAKEGQKIIDTHLGSNSNGIAAYFSKMGEFVGIEKDKDYFKDGVNRFIKETSDMFNPQEVDYVAGSL